MNRMLVAILAGGKGTRMDILCQVRAKPAIPFAGKLRVIDFNLSNCLHSQVNNVAVLVDYQRSQLVNYIRQWQTQNGVKTPINILEPQSGAYTGTANAIYQNLDYLRKQPANRIMIMPGDHAYKMDYRKMLAFHDKVKAEVTVGVVSVPIEEASRFGVLVVGADGHVVEYAEKPEMPKSNLVSMGIYIFNKELLEKRLIEDAVEPASLHDFGYSVIPGIIGRDKVFAYKFDGYWRDIGTIDAYYATSMELIGENPPMNINGKWRVLTADENNDAVKKFPKGNVVNSIVSPGCVIKGRVENSVLSPGVWVDEHAVVKNSILMSKTFVGYHSVVDSCIADEETNIGKFCYVGFGNQRKSGNDYTIIGKGVVIPSHTAIAHGCKIAPFSNPSESMRTALPKDYQFVEATKPSILAT